MNRNSNNNIIINNNNTSKILVKILIFVFWCLNNFGRVVLVSDFDSSLNYFFNTEGVGIFYTEPILQNVLGFTASPMSSPIEHAFTMTAHPTVIIQSFVYISDLIVEGVLHGFKNCKA